MFGHYSAAIATSMACCFAYKVNFKCFNIYGLIKYANISLITHSFYFSEFHDFVGTTTFGAYLVLFRHSIFFFVVAVEQLIYE